MRKTNAGRRAGNHLQSKDSKFSYAPKEYLNMRAGIAIKTQSVWGQIKGDGIHELIEAACWYALFGNESKAMALCGEAAALWPQMRRAVEQSRGGRIQL